MNSDLQVFVEKVFGINPSMGGILNGGAAGNSFSRSAFVVLEELKRSTAELATELRSGAEAETVETLVKSIQGDLLLLQTLGEISEGLMHELIAELDGLSL